MFLLLILNIYDYYYKNSGNCDRIDVNGKTIVDYEYKVNDSEISTSSDQYINRITYSDGYVEEQMVDKYGNVYAKYADGNIFYSVSSPSENKIVYYDNEISHRNVIESSDSGYTFTQQKSSLAFIFSYSSETVDDVTTITQTHFNEKQYQNIIDENSITYTSPGSSFVYTTNSDDDSITETITNSDTAVLSSGISYDEDNNVFRKSYDEYNILYSNTYDENGNIIADENNSYTYNASGELTSVSGNINSSYTYDERGNILSKTVNGETAEFTYNTAGWKDQLISVNGEALAYDSNGNLISYDGKEYTWSHGQRLETVTDGENRYFYSYDSNGNRTSKYINSDYITFDVMNGKLLAQYSDTEEIYFQYYNDTPIGFILNDVQYFYLTNLSGDVTGITDAQGNLIATYSYDEWGKLLSIETAEEDNEEQLELATLNPLRYRGYYYDSETGLYYLQSRYYDPELCRFISADDFAYISNDEQLNLNAYSYCANNPVNYSDPAGNTPISNKLENLILKLFDKFVLSIENAEENLDDLFVRFIEKFKLGTDKIKEKYENYKLRIQSINDNFQALYDKAKVALQNYQFRELFNIFSMKNILGCIFDNQTEITATMPVLYASGAEEDTRGKAIVQVLFGGIIINSIYNAFSAIDIDLNDIMNKSIKNGWFELFKELMYTGVAIFSAGSIVIKDYFQIINMAEKGYDSIFDWLIKENEKAGDLEEANKGSSFLKVFSLISALISFTESIDNSGNGALSKNADITLSCIKLVFNIAVIFAKINPFLSVLLSFIGDIIPRVIAMRLEGIVIC